jgi:hypothetical protein
MSETYYLFNIEADPGEQDKHVESNPETLATMRERLLAKPRS